MENKKINIAELLKDCPKGMELDCAIYENVTLVQVQEGYDYPIVIETPSGQMFLSKYGCFSKNELAKCVIFPKGKTTWEDFVPPCKFKDGDIVVTKTSNNFIFYSIYKGVENNKVLSYVDYHLDSNRLMFNDNLNYLCFIDEIVEQRFATEEEKQKLFQAIKDNGYHWNEKTHTLEKLVEPKFKVGDIIQDIVGICKVKITEVNLKNEYYLYKSLNINGIGDISFNRQDNWKLVPTKFDITTLKPFDKVLVRGGIGQKWTHDFFGFLDKDKGFPFVCVGYYVSQCIPFEGNEHLLGTTDDCDEYYKNW